MAASLFSPIPNRGRDALPMINEHPFGPDQKGVCFLDSITRNLTDAFVLDTCVSANSYGFSCS